MPFLRPGQGFKKFQVLKKTGTVSAAGSIGKSSSFAIGEVIGLLVGASQKEKEQWKQDGHPISHKIIQRGVFPRGKATQYMKLTEDVMVPPDNFGEPPKKEEVTRYFYIQGTKNPAEWNHEIIYYVEERKDLQ